MKRSMFLLAVLSYSFSAHAAELAKPLDPGQLAQALKAGKSVKVAFANRNSDGKAVGCIGVDGAKTSSNAALMWFRCDLPTSDHPNNQYWTLTPTKVANEEGVFLTIKNSKSQKCMGVDGASPLPGADIRQFDCKNHANQKWKLTTIKRGHRTALSLQNYDRLCIGVAGSMKVGTPLKQEKCNAEPDQDWRAIPFRVN
jgi:hypothetical protein